MPARIGQPPLTLGVMLDQAGEVVEIRAGNELPDGHAREPHTFRQHPGL